jgi:hypothetical protein
MNVEFAYDHRTSVVTSLNGSALDFATNVRRLPVSFRGQIKEPVLMRQLMTAMHEVIIGDYRESQNWRWVLDPVITVHPDEIFFEAFSTDESVYGRLSAPLAAFEMASDPIYGTTNIDFTWSLRNSLQDLRSSRRTEFTIGASGFGVETKVGAVSKTHYEHKVDLPESWLKGFLQVQGALAMSAYTFDVRPADLLTVIAFFQDNPKMNLANGMRYDFQPDKPIGIYLEPWNNRFALKGTSYTGYERNVRVWGRKRLELLLGVLPYADKVTVGVLGRGMPHFYICHCGPYKFTLVLSGWTRNDWAKGSSFDLMSAQRDIDAETVATVYNYLSQQLSATQEWIAIHTLRPDAEVQHALFELCRAGRVIYDPTTGQYRMRELFQEPLDMKTLFAPDPRIDRAKQLFEDGNVTLLSVAPSEIRRREIRSVALVADGAENHNILLAVDDEGRIRFGQCQCQFFKDNIMSRGPCEHILAVRTAYDQHVRQSQEAVSEV